jgi:predicted Zn-dependent protease with MMP-like domain
MPDSKDHSPEESSGADHVGDLDERSFEDLEDRVDQLAASGQDQQDSSPRRSLPENGPIRSEADFEAAVRTAINELPDEIQRKLDDVVITVADDGHTQHAYGMYVPGVGSDDGYRWWFFGLGRRATLNQIIIYRDTLERDYGTDQSLLRAKITETVRHEVGHALGFDEAGVQRLGL